MVCRAEYDTRKEEWLMCSLGNKLGGDAIFQKKHPWVNIGNQTSTRIYGRKDNNQIRLNQVR